MKECCKSHQYLKLTALTKHIRSNFVTFRKHLKAYFLLVFINDKVTSGWTSL